LKKSVLALLAAVLLAVLQCGGKGPRIERLTENGVEIVINHLEPYRLPGVPATLKLEELLSINTEKEEIARTGLTSIESFCLDRDGNIFCMMRQSPDKFIYKFDPSGKFLTAFGHKGQGPGEFDWGGDILVDDQNRIRAKDMTKGKFYIFDTDGRLLEEVKLGRNLSLEKYLGRHMYLTWWQETDPEKPILRNHYCISNDDFSENREFYTYEFEDPGRAARWRPVGRAVILGASDKNIFVGDASAGYEIKVFDFSGKLRRKIRKAYRPVPVPAEFRDLLQKVMGRYTRGQELLNKLELAPHLPPFRYLFTDDQERLYVMSSEWEGERNYWYDIFTSDGVFIGSVQLDNVEIRYVDGQRYSAQTTPVVVRGDRLYDLRENAGGFNVLSVYKMIWQ
jgi:hypothetical protein